MDNLLARSMAVRQENKIMMRSPSWPDSPLHQYFESVRSNKKGRDFVLSSLGYIRLYQFCSPHDQLAQDSGYESSFVHLEERMRSDGPFVLYRSSPQRGFYLGLTERDREKRLLKYYKYFQGFQRKLQVSRQFQQNQHAATNKAKVKKIISYYKPEIQQHLETSAPAPTPSKRPETPNEPGAPSKESGPAKKPAQKSSTPQKGGKSKKRVKSSKTVKATAPKACTDTAEIENLAAVLASFDNNASKLAKKKERCAVAPNLDTIEENSKDCELTEPGPTLDPPADERNISSKKLPNMKQQIAEIPYFSREANEVPLRGILKHPKQATAETPSKEEAAKSEDANQANVKTHIPASADHQNKEPKRSKRKLRRRGSVKKTAETSRLLATFPGSERHHVVSRDGSAKNEETSRKARRVRPGLGRSADSPTRSVKSHSSKAQDEAEHSVIVDEDEEDDFEAPYPGYEDEDGKKEEEKEEEEEKKEEEEEKKEEEEGKKEEEKKEEEETALEEPSEIPWEAPKSLRIRSGNKGSAKRNFNVPPGNIIKFRGWDMGTTLKEHTMDHFPEEMDLLDQMIQRAEKLQWAVNPQTVPAENMYLTVPKIDLDTEDCKRYIQKKDIMQMFERFTKVLVHQQPPNPLDVLHGYASDLAEQHRNERSIEDDLSSGRRASQASTFSNKSTRTARLSTEGSRTRYSGPVKITSSYLDRDSHERRSIPEHPTPSQLTMDPEDSLSL